MINLDFILKQYRMNANDDGWDGGYQVNRLFGLNDLAKENLNKNSIVCEVGSFQGHSSLLFAYYCKKIYCVDYFSIEFNGFDYEPVFDKNMSYFNNIEKIKAYSIDAAKMFGDGFFDLVYIDAGHLYNDVYSDILAWKPKVKSGGYLAGHDYMYDVSKAITDLLGFPDKIYMDSSWIKRCE